MKWNYNTSWKRKIDFLISHFSQACTSAFATKDRLRSHMIRHEGKVTCNICGKMLSAAYITSHLKTHGQASFNSPCNNKGRRISPSLAHFCICNNIAAVMITDVEHLDGQRGSNSSQNEVKITFLWGLPYCTFGAQVWTVVTWSGVAASHSHPHTRWTKPRTNPPTLFI